MKSSNDHNIKILLLFFNAIFFGCTLGMNAIGVISGIFEGNDNTTHHYDLKITPPPWTFFVMWPIIYIMSAALIVYSLVNIIRETPTGNLYYSPDIITAHFLVSYMCNWFCNSTWILTAMEAQENTSFLLLMAILLWLLFLSLAFALIYSYQALDKALPALTKFGMTADIWTVRVLIHNGVSIYATWTVVASSLNVAMTLKYYMDVCEDTADAVALLIVMTLAAAYVAADIFMLDRWTRYVLAPHCTLVLAVSGILVKALATSSHNTTFVITLLSVCSASLLVKIVLTVIRSLKK